MTGWRTNTNTTTPRESPNASPTITAVTGNTAPRSASASRQSSRHNSPPTPHMQNTTSTTTSGTSNRYPFNLPSMYPRSASTDRFGPGSSAYGRSTSATHPSGNSSSHGNQLVNSSTGVYLQRVEGGQEVNSSTGIRLQRVEGGQEEEREKQKARLDQLFAAAGQRLSAQGYTGKASPSAHPSAVDKDGAAAAAAATTGSSASSTPAESAVGRSPAPAHHASYRPYDIPAIHRSTSRAGTATPSGLSARTSPNHLASSQQLPSNKTEIRRPASAASQSSSSAESNADLTKKRHIPGIVSPSIHAHLSPPISTAGGKPLVGGGALGDDAMAIDEAEEDQLGPLDDENGNAGEHSPPFGVTFGAGASGAERRGRSTTRKAREMMMMEEGGGGGSAGSRSSAVGDHVVNELNALRMRDSSRSSTFRAADSHSPDGMKGHESEHWRSGELPRPSHLGQVHSQAYAYSPSGLPRSGRGTPEIEDGIVKNALLHRPLSDLRASASPHPTLPSLSEALSSSASSRSLSASRGGGSSRHSSGARTAMSQRPSSVHSMLDDMPQAAGILPLPNTGFDEIGRLRTRIQELEFINGLMESRVADLEATISANPDKAPTAVLAPHGPNCSCRCSEIDLEASKAAEHLKKELLTHGVGGIGEQASRDLLDLLVHRLGYRTANKEATTTTTGASSSSSANGGHVSI